MSQRDLFGDEKENRRLEVQGNLHVALRQLARHYCEGRATIHIERVDLGPAEQVTACAWLNGRRCAVLHRADVHSAARDLWTQACPNVVDR